ncbi:MAG: acyloxyacyl hydrolase [Nitrospinales bacterium]
MRNLKCVAAVLALLSLGWSLPAEAGKFSPTRFKKGSYDFGFQLGYGAGLNIPSGPDRTDVQFGFFAPNFKYDLLGNIGQSFYQGNLYFVSEIDFIFTHHPATGYLIGGSPILQYKFIKPKKRKWAPTILAGIGFANTDLDKKSVADREISGNFQFLIHFGLGLEFFKSDRGSISLNYRYFHISNAGIESPNIGLNTNVFTLGFSF